MRNLQIIKKEHQRIGYSENDIEIAEYKELEADYDENGLLSREARYNPDGSLNTLTINTYNEHKELSVAEQYDQDNILLQKTENTYNDSGLLQEQTNYYGDASDKYTTKYIYNSEGLVERQEVYFNGELDYVEKTTTYKDGRVDTLVENDDYGNPMYSSHYEYNEKGLVSVFTHDEIQNKDRRTYEFTYNDNNDRIKDLIYDYDMKLIAKANRIFDENHHLLEYIEEDLDNYRQVKMEYEGDLVKKNTIFDKKGEIVSWAEYEYDENGKEVKSVEYAHDEVNPEKMRIVRETLYIRS